MARELRVAGEIAPELAGALAWTAELDTLEDVLHRGLTIVEVIVQDEYTHDVVTTHRGVYLVFDTT